MIGHCRIVLRHSFSPGPLDTEGLLLLLLLTWRLLASWEMLLLLLAPRTTWGLGDGDDDRVDVLVDGFGDDDRVDVLVDGFGDDDLLEVDDGAGVAMPVQVHSVCRRTL